MKNILQKGLEKYVKSSIIETFHGNERISDEKLNDSINSDLWIDDGIHDENEELTKRNWPFFAGILIFYITFLILISYLMKSN